MGKSVVIVNTSAGAMGGGPTGVWLSDMGDPYFGEQAKKFMHDKDAVSALTHSVKVEASMADKFDCVYLAGGHGCCVDFVGGAAKELKALIEAAYAAGKIVAADCHGPMG